MRRKCFTVLRFGMDELVRTVEDGVTPVSKFDQERETEAGE